MYTTAVQQKRLLHGNSYAVVSVGCRPNARYVRRSWILAPRTAHVAAYALQFCATSALPRPLSSEERYMLREAEPVGAACLSGSRRGGAAGLEGRARRAPTMQKVTKRRSEPPALPRASAAYGIPARPVGTTPPTTPSTISPIAALTDAIIDTPPLLPQDLANAMPAARRGVRQRDVLEMQEIVQSAVANPMASCSRYRVTLTLCR